ncbi:MAG: hypothetical protein HXO72_05705 [Scardovia wiggsiae]|uniref:hypothetical protein n=1 Tax=Scardovia wiggsiae TaxID=230143 RepID=UPI001CB43FE9|nr:hypothetical protein [Scardovia wiggsiae]MBF1674509.1 hypothetical protein [Scardovia wiggsiae]
MDSSDYANIRSQSQFDSAYADISRELRARRDALEEQRSAVISEYSRMEEKWLEANSCVADTVRFVNELAAEGLIDEYFSSEAGLLESQRCAVFSELDDMAYARDRALREIDETYEAFERECLHRIHELDEAYGRFRKEWYKGRR